MRAIVVALVAIALSASGVASGAVDGRRPALQITDLTPLTVQGTGFRPRERVKLLVAAGGPLSRTVRAGQRGRFHVRFGVRVSGGCTAIVVQAIGARGSRARAEVTARPGCDEQP